MKILHTKTDKEVKEFCDFLNQQASIVGGCGLILKNPKTNVNLNQQPKPQEMKNSENILNKMMYKTLEGKMIDLKLFSVPEKNFLRFAYKNYLSAEGVKVNGKYSKDYGDYFQTMIDDSSLEIMGGKLKNGKYYISEETIKHPLYRIIRDLTDRKAIDQHYLKKELYDDISFTHNQETLDELFN